MVVSKAITNQVSFTYHCLPFEEQCIQNNYEKRNFSFAGQKKYNLGAF